MPYMLLKLTAIISLKIINRIFFPAETESVYSAVRTESLSPGHIHS